MYNRTSFSQTQSEMIQFCNIVASFVYIYSSLPLMHFFFIAVYFFPSIGFYVLLMYSPFLGDVFLFPFIEVLLFFQKKKKKTKKSNASLNNLEKSVSVHTAIYSSGEGKEKTKRKREREGCEKSKKGLWLFWMLYLQEATYHGAFSLSSTSPLSLSLFSKS